MAMKTDTKFQQIMLREERIRLRHLRVIAAIDANGSSAAAASALLVTPAAISKTVAELEDIVGTPLLERTGRQSRLTAAGRLLVQTSYIVTRELDVLASRLDFLLSGVIGTIRIGIQAVSAERQVAALISRFKAAYPDVEVQMIDGILSSLIDDLRSGLLDLVVGRVTDNQLGSDLARRALGDDSFVVMSSDPVIKANKNVGWRDVLASQWCLPAAGSSTRTAFDAFLSIRDFPRPRSIIETKSIQMIYWLLVEAPCCALVPSAVAPSWEQGRDGPRRLKLSPELNIPAVCVIWPTVMSLSPTAEAFLNILDASEDHVATGT